MHHQVFIKANHYFWNSSAYKTGIVEHAFIRNSYTYRFGWHITGGLGKYIEFLRKTICIGADNHQRQYEYPFHLKKELSDKYAFFSR